MPGLLQAFKVASDSDQNLKLALGIPLQWHNKATHYKQGIEQGFSWLELRWCDAEGAIQLPFPLTTQDEFFNFVTTWLKNASYGRETDTDGSTSKGWRVSCRDNFYTTIKIQTEWIVYGK